MSRVRIGVRFVFSCYYYTQWLLSDIYLSTGIVHESQYADELSK